MKSKIQTQLDLEIIRYSMVWEDYQLLYQGLAIQPEDHIFSIGSAGDNVLNLLVKNPQKITVVDFNPLQNALLRLKIVAFQQLTYQEFISVLGLSSEKVSNEVLEKLFSFLDQEEQNYWKSHIDLFEQGLYKSGRLEQYFLQFVEALKVQGLAELTRKMYASNSLEEQQKYWEELKQTNFKEVFQEYYNQENLGKGGRSEIQYKYVKTNSETHFWKQIDYTLSNLHIKNTPYLSFFLLGELTPQSFPEYLKEENFELLKKKVSSIKIHTNSVETFLHHCPNSTFSKGNFSNLFEYLSEEESNKLFTLISEKFTPQAKIAYWNLLNIRNTKKVSELTYQKELSIQLHKQDCAWFYRDFRIEQVIK